MPTIRSLCGILPLPSLLVRALAPKQLFGLKEDTGTGPRSPSGFTSGTHGLSSSDGRLLLNRPFAHSARSPRHKGLSRPERCCLNRPVALHRDAVAGAGVGPIVPHRVVLDAAVVPEGDRVLLPAKAALEQRVRHVLVEIAQRSEER